MSSVEELVEALEELTLGEQLEDPEHLVDLLAFRAELLAALESADMSELPPAVRGELKVRLAAVLERDAALLPRLLARREEIAAQLEQVPQGRAAARGYGEQQNEVASTLRRFG